MSCSPERITGYVDEALPESEREELERHLASCAACREQAASERELRERLRALPAPEPRPGFEAELRRSLRRARPGRWRVLLPLAAALAALVLWQLGTAPVVAWQLARDHDHCFGSRQLPAQVWTSESRAASAWFEQHGSRLPPVPDSPGGLLLVGGRHCPLLDRSVAHLYYVGGERQVSLFVVPGNVRFESRYETTARGKAVRLIRVAGTIVALVGRNAEDVDTVEQSFRTTSADMSVETGSSRGPLPEV